MKQLLIIGSLVLWNVSCSEVDSKPNTSSDKDLPRKAEAEQITTDEKSSLPDLPVATDYREYDFHAFLDRFKSAVKEGKTEDIVGMTRFPFETRGEMDSDPVIRFSKKEFFKLLPELLNQYAGVDLDGTSEQELLLETTDIDQEEIDRRSVRIGSLVFEKMKTGWKFTFAYVSAPTYEVIGVDNGRN